MREFVIKSKTYGEHTILLDDEDFGSTCRFKWSVNKHAGILYCSRNIRIGGKFRTQYLHQFLANTPEGSVTDHINGNTLDNRKENLRVCTKHQNNMNKRLRRDNTSGFKGVVWNETTKKWVAYIKFNNETINLGHFDTRERASQIYELEAKKLFGEYRRENNV